MGLSNYGTPIVPPEDAARLVSTIRRNLTAFQIAYAFGTMWRHSWIKYMGPPGSTRLYTAAELRFPQGAQALPQWSYAPVVLPISDTGYQAPGGNGGGTIG